MQNPRSNSSRSIRFAIWPVVILAVAAVGVLAYSRMPNRTAPVQPLDPNLRGTPIDSAVATPVAKTTPSSPSDEAPVFKRDYLPINFTLLALFPFNETDEMHDLAKYPQATAKVAEQIPAYVKTYEGRKVELDGYMMPLTMKDGMVTKFLLMQNQSSCCYGVVPQMNEWVEVDMASRPVKDLMDVVIRVSGTFHVGEVRTPKGLLSGIYRMDGEKLEVPEPEFEADAAAL